MEPEIEFLVAGLGNPGEEYENSPHNLGFRVMDRLAESNAIRVSRKENLALVGLGTIRQKRVALGQAANVYEFEWTLGKGSAGTVRVKSRTVCCSCMTSWIFPGAR